MNKFKRFVFNIVSITFLFCFSMYCSYLFFDWPHIQELEKVTTGIVYLGLFLSGFIFGVDSKEK